MLLPVGLKYLKTTVVAIYGYLILIVATIASLALGGRTVLAGRRQPLLFLSVLVYI